MANWNEKRDKRWVKMMRECDELAVEHKDLIDRFEETGDLIFWSAFIDLIRKMPVRVAAKIPAGRQVSREKFAMPSDRK